MRTIYLVIVHSGSYEDSASEPRKAFSSREKAEAFTRTEFANIESARNLRKEVDCLTDRWQESDPRPIGAGDGFDAWRKRYRDEYERISIELGFDASILPLFVDDRYHFGIQEISFED